MTPQSPPPDTALSSREASLWSKDQLSFQNSQPTGKLVTLQISTLTDAALCPAVLAVLEKVLWALPGRVYEADQSVPATMAH